MLELPTDESLDVAWKQSTKVRPGEALHLVVAWWLREPERIGQVAPPIGGTAMSRRQLALTPRPDGTVEVQREGKRELFHNGRHVERCIVQAGDTLMLEDAAVFVVESRPEIMPGLWAYKGPFPFGEADPFGMVGETPIMWRLRDQIASVAQQSFHVLVLGPSGWARSWWRGPCTASRLARADRS